MLGTMVYMTPLGKGVSRLKANWGEGWGSANGSFWCCYGTGIESFSKLGDSIYFLDASADAANKGMPALWVTQYVSSSVMWDEAGLNLTQKARYANDSSALLTRITMKAQQASPALTAQQRAAKLARAANSTIRLRVPGWAVPAATTIELNGKSVLGPDPPLPGSFVSISRAFADGDELAASFGMAPHLVRIRDDRPEFATVYSIMYGPLLLAGLTTTPTFVFKAEPRELAQWLQVGSALSFTATGVDGIQLQLRPLNRLVDENYTAFFNISVTASDAPMLCLGDPHGHELPAEAREYHSIGPASMGLGGS